MSTRDELIADITKSALSRSQSTGRALELHRELLEITSPPMADDLIAEGWRKKPSEQELFSRDPDSALAAFVDSFNGDEAGDIDWVCALDGNTGYAMRGGNDVESVFRKAAAAILALMDRGQ